MRTFILRPSREKSPIPNTGSDKLSGAHATVNVRGSALMVFLMSDECGFVSGAEIPVDGGMSSGGVAKALSDAVRVEIPVKGI
jgi:hypothetical protein